MDLVDYLMSAEDADGKLLSNLIETQIQISENEKDDLEIFESLVFDSSRERTYNALDCRTSARILEIFNVGKEHGKKCTNEKKD